jgi:hypothetical protein
MPKLLKAASENNRDKHEGDGDREFFHLTSSADSTARRDRAEASPSFRPRTN